MKKNITLLRTIAILLVVIGHITFVFTGSWVFKMPENPSIVIILCKLIYTFHMPVFISISGYLFYYTIIEKNSNILLKEYIIKKLKRLIIPFCTVLILWVIPIKILAGYYKVLGYDSLNEMNFDLLLKAELTRAFFNYLHKNHILYNSETKQALEQLKQYASNKLYMEKKEYSTEIVLVDESIVRLRIIYDIAPYILDNLNDVDCFEKLYVISTKLSDKLSGTPTDKNIFKYMENVFNRKAFLFINETQCNIYYDKAKKYFYENSTGMLIIAIYQTFLNIFILNIFS